MFFVYLPIVSFYTAQSTCMESIQAKVKDVKYVYLSLVKVKVDILVDWLQSETLICLKKKMIFFINFHLW